MQSQKKETLLYSQLQRGGEIKALLEEVRESELFRLEDGAQWREDVERMVLNQVQLVSGTNILPRLALLGQRHFENTLLALEVALLGPMAGRLNHECQKMITAMMMRCGMLLAVEPRSIMVVYRALV